MGGLRTEAAYNGTDFKPVARCIYDTGKSSSCKTWNISPPASTKGGGNEVVGYSGEYAPQTDCNKISAPTVIVRVGQINKTTTLSIYT